MCLNVYESGIMVKTKVGNIEGMITCTSIRFEKVQYEITYFAGLDQKTVWMCEQEFDTTGPKIKIGFK